VKKLIFVLGLVIPVLAGDFVKIDQTAHVRTYGIRPECLNSAADTIGPIELEGSSYWSVNLALTKLTGKDTAIVDSGFEIHARSSYSKKKSDITKPNSADSVINFWGDADVDNRAENKSKALALDAARYLWLIFVRTDTNADTLDYKNDNGIAAMDATTLSIFTPRYR